MSKILFIFLQCLHTGIRLITIDTSLNSNRTMITFKFKANILLVIAALLVFCSCFAQMNTKEQNQTATSDSIDILSHFNSELLKQQTELFKYDGYFAFRFGEIHRKMNLVAALDINKNDTIFIVETITRESSSCASIAFNSRNDISRNYNNQQEHYNDLDYLRPLLQRWDKKEIEEKGKRKHYVLGDIGRWFISRVIVQPDTLIVDGIVVDELPHTITKEEIEMEQHLQENAIETQEREKLKDKKSKVFNAND